jgi:hypothetical protein
LILSIDIGCPGKGWVNRRTVAPSLRSDWPLSVSSNLATIGLILNVVLRPSIILTLSVVYFLINGLMFKLTSEFVPGFKVNGRLPA